MTVMLSDDEAVTLRDLLHDQLRGLKFEGARTHDKELRHVLAKRVALCERLIEQLSRTTTTS